MKSVLDSDTRSLLIERINQLTESSTALWGSMNIYQMIRHCVLCDEMYLGKTKYDRVFLGYIFGQKALRSLTRDDKPLQRNARTLSSFIVSETSGDVIAEKTKWISLIHEYESLPNTDVIHWFFGKMTREEVGYFAYKHIDHHLRQFDK